MVQTSIAKFFKPKSIEQPKKALTPSNLQLSPTSVVELSMMEETPNEVVSQSENRYVVYLAK